jgi:ATP-dependent Clp protease ATP-binding subunit ClpC
MLGRFTDSVRIAVAHANQLAQKLGHDHIALEHVFVGLLRAKHGIAAEVLRSFDLDRSVLERVVTQKCPLPVREDDRSLPLGKLPQTPQFKTVMTVASVNATMAGRDEIDTGDVLQALCEQESGVPKVILTERGIASSLVAQLIARMRSERPRDRTLPLAGGPVGEDR